MVNLSLLGAAGHRLCAIPILLESRYDFLSVFVLGRRPSNYDTLQQLKSEVRPWFYEESVSYHILAELFDSKWIQSVKRETAMHCNYCCSLINFWLAFISIGAWSWFKLQINFMPFIAADFTKSPQYFMLFGWMERTHCCFLGTIIYFRGGGKSW